jgi:hypothetical protein
MLCCCIRNTKADWEFQGNVLGDEHIIDCDDVDSIYTLLLELFERVDVSRYLSMASTGECARDTDLGTRLSVRR